MSQFSIIRLSLASGPGIASPNIDRFDINRSDLAESEAIRLDQLIAAVDFTNADQTSLVAAAIADGPHKSSLTVTFLDETTQRASFRGTPHSRELQALVGYVTQNFRSEASEP